VQNADSFSLFDDLDAALRSGSREKRLAMPRQVTGLFPGQTDRSDERQIGIFGQAPVRPVEIAETRTPAKISENIAAVMSTPVGLMPKPARHSEIEIARPLPANFSRPTTAHPVAIARTGSKHHVLAISQRAQIEAAVADVLLDRSGKAAPQGAAGSLGAQFSERGRACAPENAERHGRSCCRRTAWERDTRSASLISSSHGSQTPGG
jgi:hypothetical protein